MAVDRRDVPPIGRAGAGRRPPLGDELERSSSPGGSIARDVSAAARGSARRSRRRGAGRARQERPVGPDPIEDRLRRPVDLGAGPSTIPSACRRPNSTRTASPVRRSARLPGRVYVEGASPRRPPRRRRPRRAARAVMGSDAGAPVGVGPAFSAMMISSMRRRFADLAGLVADHVVVVLLAGELERGVALADVEVIGGLGGAR